jgi:hypothetical protein
MVTINEEKLINTLCERYSYSVQEIQKRVNMYKFENLNNQLQSSFDLWLDNNQISDFKVNDISFKQIMEKEKIDFIDALFSMNTLLENPELAEKYNDLKFYRCGLGSDIKE